MKQASTEAKSITGEQINTLRQLLSKNTLTVKESFCCLYLPILFSLYALRED
jgi:hypothetical protein